MPNVPPGHGTADVTIRYEALEAPPPDLPQTSPVLRVTDDEVLLYWDLVGHILVRDGRQVLLDLRPEADKAFVVQVLQGVVMGALLRQRNVLTLHASAIAVDDHAVAFMGFKGWGKSTTAAALHERGYPFVTDDLLVLRTGDTARRIAVHPGIPQFNLWPAAAASLGYNPELLPRIFPQVTKRACRAKKGFQHPSLPLRCIYVLDYASEEDAPLAIEPLTPRDACIELITHSYAARLGTSPFHLHQCALVAQRVPLRRLTRPSSLHELSEIARCVEADLACNTPDVLQG